MKKIKSDGKLALNPETLKNLSSEEADRAVGGAAGNPAGAIELTMDRSVYVCSKCPACRPA